MTDATIEVIVLSATTSETKKGGKTRKVTFLLPNNEGHHPFEGTIGDRLHLVFLRINDDETVEVPEPPKEKPKRKWHEMGYPARAAMLSEREAFKKFAQEKFPRWWHDAGQDAAEFIRQWCFVHSRADIVQGGESGFQYERLEDAFDDWMKEPVL